MTVRSRHWSLVLIIQLGLLACGTITVIGAIVTHQGSPAAGEDEPRAYGGETQPAMLADCWREGLMQEGDVEPMTWQRFMTDNIGQLQIRRMWWSKQPTTVPITVITQLSTSRLPQLEAQCRSWPGPLSAAVYVPLIELNEEDLRAAGEEGEMALEQQRQHVLHEMQAAVAAARHTRKALAGLVHQYERQLREQTTWSAQDKGLGPSSDMFDTWEQPESEFNAARLSSHNKKLMHLADRAVAALLAAVEKQVLGCQLSIALVYEVVADVRSATILYPVNQLRNLARLQARTELVAQLDVDMLTSWDTAAWLRQGRNLEGMVQDCRSQSVYIMPAFEVHAADIQEEATLADKFSMLSKGRLKRAVDQGVITHFDALRFPQGHNTTDFPRWFKSSTAYPITYTYRLEPWLIVHRLQAPWHDVRFRGYGNNKIQQVMHLNASAFTFLVHPAAFIIHRAHPLTHARMQLLSDLESLRAAKWQGINTTLYGHNQLMLQGIKQEMDAGTFEPVLDAPTRHCFRVLPWMTSALGAPPPTSPPPRSKGKRQRTEDLSLRPPQ